MSNREKGLSPWQLTLMALGSVIGGSFFLGSSVAVNAAGPGVLVSYIICGVVVHYILYAISEMTISNPDSGSFRTFAEHAFGRGTGFVVGWVYWTGMVLAMSSEATAVSILVRQWFPSVSVPLLGGLIITAVTLVNLLGAVKLSRLEGALAAVKVFGIIFFVVIAILLIAGLFPGKAAIGLGALTREPFFPNGASGVAGSMLIVMFAYAGFEIIGLAASEAKNPKKSVPKAIRYTVSGLLVLYISTYAFILPLIPTTEISADKSPLVAALGAMGIGWAGMAMNILLISAILSTMLAAVFGIGRMMRSLADEGLAPKLLKDKTEVPYRGIVFSGLSMLAGLCFALLAPQVYLFLISSGGFALLFTYAIIMATHIRLRVMNGRPAPEDFQMRGFPFSSLFVLLFLIVSIVSMPIVPGQGAGLLAGIVMAAFYVLCYLAMKLLGSRRKRERSQFANAERARFMAEIAKELSHTNDEGKQP